MSEAELHGLINGLYETAQGMIDFWISVTFAVILARFFGARVLSRKVLRTVTGLYVLATALSIARWGVLLARALEYQERLGREGYPAFYQPAGSLGIGVLVVVLYTLGTWATVSFLVGRWAPRTESEDGMGGR